MTRPTRIEINCETGVESIIELTDAEIAQMEADAAAAATRQAEEAAAAQAAADAKASAQAKLTALGLTAEEISALTKQPILYKCAIVYCTKYAVIKGMCLECDKKFRKQFKEK